MNKEARLLLPDVPHGYPAIVVMDGIRYFTNGDVPVCDECSGPVDGDDTVPVHCVACTFTDPVMGTCPKCEGVSIADNVECWYCCNPWALPDFCEVRP